MARDFLEGFSFVKRYSKPYILTNNLMPSKISINTVNDDQRKFVLDLMKGYNVSIFFKNIETKDLDIRNLYEKS